MVTRTVSGRKTWLSEATWVAGRLEAGRGTACTPPVTGARAWSPVPACQAWPFLCLAFLPSGPERVPSKHPVSLLELSLIFPPCVGHAA